MAGIKCWNAREPFDPELLRDKIANQKYDWMTSKDLVRKGKLPPQEKVIKTVLKEYTFLKDLDKQLLKVVEDSKTHKEEKPVAELLLKVNDQLKA